MSGGLLDSRAPNNFGVIAIRLVALPTAVPLTVRQWEALSVGSNRTSNQGASSPHSAVRLPLVATAAIRSDSSGIPVPAWLPWRRWPRSKPRR